MAWDIEKLDIFPLTDTLGYCGSDLIGLNRGQLAGTDIGENNPKISAGMVSPRFFPRSNNFRNLASGFG